MQGSTRLRAGSKLEDLRMGLGADLGEGRRIHQQPGRFPIGPPACYLGRGLAGQLDVSASRRAARRRPTVRRARASLRCRAVRGPARQPPRAHGLVARTVVHRAPTLAHGCDDRHCGRARRRVRRSRSRPAREHRGDRQVPVRVNAQKTRRLRSRGGSARVAPYEGKESLLARDPFEVYGARLAELKYSKVARQLVDEC